MKHRTKDFAVRVIRLAEALPRTTAGNTVARQLVRAATGVAANYRSACRARSNPDFVAKMGIVEEEADEAIFWMELVADCGMLRKERLLPLLGEAEELLAITVASVNTARGGRRGREIRNPCLAGRQAHSAIRNRKA